MTADNPYKVTDDRVFTTSFHNFISDQRCLQDYSLYCPTDIITEAGNNNNKDIWDQIQSLFWEKEKCVEEQEWKKSFSKTILASWSTMTLTISIYLCCCQSHILPKLPDSGKTCFEMTVCIRQELYKHRVSFPKSPNLSLGALAWEGKVTNCKACFT